MILNFYLRKKTPLARMRDVEIEQFEKVKTSLRRKGVNPNRIEYQEAIARLAGIVASEVKDGKTD